LLIVDPTKYNQCSEHLYSIDSAFLFGVECLEGFLIVSEYLYKLTDSDREGLADWFVWWVVLAEFGWWTV